MRFKICLSAKRGIYMTLVNELTTIRSNENVGPNLYIMQVYAPQICSAVLPGQFVHIKIPHMDDHILRRPFSVFCRSVQQGTIDILYQLVGHGTSKMVELGVGTALEMIGPIGSFWHPPEETRKALLVGGGVGAAPLFMLAQKLLNTGVETHIILGASTSSALVCRPHYDALDCARLSFSTDDGSFGFAGFCTPLVEKAIADTRNSGTKFDFAAVCGPEPFMKIASEIVLDANVPCQISMERRMACGIGACLSCVVETTSGKKRSCVDGPIFNAEEIIW